MKTRKMNPWIFALSMFLILFQYYGIADKNLAAVFAVIGTLCAIYAVHTNESILKFNTYENNEKMNFT